MSNDDLRYEYEDDGGRGSARMLGFVLIATVVFWTAVAGAVWVYSAQPAEACPVTNPSCR